MTLSYLLKEVNLTSWRNGKREINFFQCIHSEARRAACVRKGREQLILTVWRILILMLITFGKHMSKSLEFLVLKHPDYIGWMLNQRAATRKLADAQQAALRLIRIFNQKQILTRCRNPG